MDEFLPLLARALADATGASRTGVWVRVGDRMQLAASHPEHSGVERAFPDADTVAEVRDADGPVGAITLTKPPGDPPTARDTTLAEALAAHAAIAFRDVARAAEPRESRRRLVAAAVYFSCTEALQNAAKHADGVPRVRLAYSLDGLEFTVSDDGPGFDPRTAAGAGDVVGGGLRNMRDRIEAVGGRLRLRSAPGAGTVVAGAVPVPSTE